MQAGDSAMRPLRNAVASGRRRVIGSFFRRLRSAGRWPLRFLSGWTHDALL